MNREIRFQSIHEEYGNGKLFIGESWGPNKDGFKSPSSYSNAKLIGHRQYTGLQDNFGRPVYEGDIIEYPAAIDEGEIRMEVVWVRIGWGIKDAFFFPPTHFNDMNASVLQNMLVIGNVYETPELLKHLTP